jgi:hypothetical protein
LARLSYLKAKGITGKYLCNLSSLTEVPAEIEEKEFATCPLPTRSPADFSDALKNN